MKTSKYLVGAALSMMALPNVPCAAIAQAPPTLSNNESIYFDSGSFKVTPGW